MGPARLLRRSCQATRIGLRYLFLNNLAVARAASPTVRSAVMVTCFIDIFFIFILQIRTPF